MRKKLLTTGLTSLLALAGCSKIETNILSVSERTKTVKLASYSPTEILIENRAYRAIPIPENKTFRAGTITFDRNTLLPFYLVPENNSQTIRTENGHEYTQRSLQGNAFVPIRGYLVPAVTSSLDQNGSGVQYENALNANN